MRTPTKADYAKSFIGVGAGLSISTLFYPKTSETKKAILATGLIGGGLIVVGWIIGMSGTALIAQPESEKK